MSIAEDCYNQGVEDERKRCFDIATERVETLMKSAKNNPWYPGFATQAIEALLISQRIDNEAWGQRWKDDKVELKTKFFVFGGVYKDTTFRQLQNESDAQEYGPFDTYQEAYDEWKARMFLNVDNALHRLTVVERLAY
jgi:hypothetical protein